MNAHDPAPPSGYAIQSFEEFEADALRRIAPPPFVSKFRAIPWEDQDLPGPEHEWLVKYVITRRERSMMVGASQSGKSFLAIDLALAIARGVPWLGNRTTRGGVIYQAGEGGRGVKKRIRAYRNANGLGTDAKLPFVLMPATLDLYGSDDQTAAFVAEVKHWAGTFDVPLELIVIDTLSAATAGADENSSKDIGPVLARCERIAEECRCAVMIVHHMNAGGHKPRGHTSILANLDSVLTVTALETGSEKSSTPMLDVDNRQIREVVTAKQKDGEAGKRWRFVLPAVTIGYDKEQEPITSCVVRDPNLDGERGETDKPGDLGLAVSTQCEVFLRSVITALDDHGESPPNNLRLGGNVPRVVQWRHVVSVFDAMAFHDEPDETKRAASRRKAMQRHGEWLLTRGVIMRHDNFVWLTGRRRVKGFPQTGQDERRGDGQGKRDREAF